MYLVQKYRFFPYFYTSYFYKNKKNKNINIYTPTSE